MDMMEVLKRAAGTVGTNLPFAARSAFATRVGKHQIFPTGLGSALDKAVREGYLRVAAEGTRRRGRAYEFTALGREAVEAERKSAGENLSGGSPS